MKNKKIFLKEIKSFQQKQTKKIKKSWFEKKKNKVKLIVLLFVTLVFAVSLSILGNWNVPLVSPITSLTTFSFLTHSELPKNNKKIVYGFLPYWNTGKVTLQKELTHLGYFSLTMDAQGKFIEYYDDGEVDMGMRRLN